MPQLKTFSDLRFKPHPGLQKSIQARMDFPNGYGVSVVQGELFYCDGPNEYEVAVFHEGHICYDTPITGDVLGHQSRHDVDDIMRQVQELPPTERAA